jgi:hypothetical protein
MSSQVVKHIDVLKAAAAVCDIAKWYMCFLEHHTHTLVVEHSSDVIAAAANQTLGFTLSIISKSRQPSVCIVANVRLKGEFA